MKIHTTHLATSSIGYTKCPHDHKPEVAFIGRSNVGKSSLINALLGRKQLARVSKKPGKTQLINHYLINNHFYLVDFPGYGWARVSHATQIKWTKMVQAYLLHRTQMVTAFLLIDAKVAPQAIDLTWIRWLGQQGIPFVLVLTKTDKKHHAIIQKNYQQRIEILEKEWEKLPLHFHVSVHERSGIETLLTYIQSITGPHTP